MLANDTHMVDVSSRTSPTDASGLAKSSNRGGKKSKGGRIKRRRSNKCEGVEKRFVQNSATGEELALVDEMVSLEAEMASLKALATRSKGLFEWVDGPLVTAMRNGELILLDELSLADDAVLERLNSVLEPGRSITLPEKGGEGEASSDSSETVLAASGFRYVSLYAIRLIFFV